MGVSRREVILRHLAATRSRYGDLIVEGSILEHHAIPVDIGIEHRIHPFSGVFYFLHEVSIAGYALRIARAHGIIIKVHILYAINKLQDFSRRRDLRLQSASDFQLTLFT